MKKSLLTLFCALCALSFIPSSVMATDYTIETIPSPATPVLSAVLPLVQTESPASSVTQQVFLASELTALGASSGDITGITFYYGGKSNTTAVPSVTRSLKIFITSIAADSIAIHEISGAYVTNYRAKFLNPGTSPVHDGSITTETIAVGEVKPLSIVFNQSAFTWDGASNILLTVFDVTNTAYSSTEANLRFVLKSTEHARFAHQYWTASGVGKAEDYLSSLAGLEAYTYTSGSTGTAKEKQVRGHLWVTKTTFTITPSAAPVAPSIPENLSASNIGATSASLSWSAVDGATSYDLYNSTSIDGVYSKFASPTTNSYDWSGLTPETSYYVKVAAINGAGSSDLSSAISFATLAPHIHDGITFEPWSNPSAMPKSGNYYLATDVAYDFYDGGYLDLNGDLNICLNGHTVDLGTKSINVTPDHTMALYDHVGGGKITGFVPGTDGLYDYMGMISVENNGTLVLREGEVENTYPNEDPEFKSIAIAVGGTLILSGAPVISSNEIDIYLPPTIPAKVITIESGKPLTNTTPYKVYKESGVITSGWANMSGANPRDYFVSANRDKSVCLNEGEAALQTLLTLSETALNSAINSNDGQIVDVNLTRPLVASQYNTLCLPFALDNTQLEEYFGAGYDLEELTSTSLEGDMLNLTFNKVTALEAGKPYLLQPADDVSSVMFFDDVTIVKTLSNTVTSYVDFKGVYRPTELEGGNKNLLFLGSGNELFWPAATADIKAFRAYFEVKGAAQKAAKRARIVQKENTTTGVDKVSAKFGESDKLLRNGQLLIIRDNKTYNVLGQPVQL